MKEPLSNSNSSLQLNQIEQSNNLNNRTIFRALVRQSAPTPRAGRAFLKRLLQPLVVVRSWLRIIAACGHLDKKRLAPLIDESLELTRMMGASVATARRRLEQEGDKEI